MKIFYSIIKLPSGNEICHGNPLVDTVVLDTHIKKMKVVKFIGGFVYLGS